MRALAIVLLFLAQAFTTFAPCFTVRCIHADGSEAIELVGSECCRAAHESDLPAAPASEHPAYPTVRASGDDCRDVPVRPDEVPVARATTRSDAAHADRVAPVAIAVSPLLPQLVVASFRYATVRGPPPDAVPRRAGRPFVLRC